MQNPKQESFYTSDGAFSAFTRKLTLFPASLGAGLTECVTETLADKHEQLRTDHYGVNRYSRCGTLADQPM